MNHTVFFLGMVVLQVIFIIYQYVLFKRKEFLFYLVYTLFISIFICFRAFPEWNPLPQLSHPEEKFTASRALLVLAYATYFRFGRHFIEAPLLFKGLNRQLIFMEWIYFSVGLSDLLLQLAQVEYSMMEWPIRILFLASMPYLIFVIIFLITRKRKLTNIFIIGSGLLLVFASISFIDQTFISKNAHSNNYYLGYLEAGVCAEFLLLNYGLFYKTRLIQKQNIELEVSKEVEIYKERMRIARDLHDDMGSTLSSIDIYSNVVNAYMATNKEKAQEFLEKIQGNTRLLMENANDLIWSLQTNYGEAESIFKRMHKTSVEMMSSANITPHIIMEEDQLPILHIAAQKNCWLIFKEAINNVCKYSRAQNCTFSVIKEEDRLIMSISDDGIGCEFPKRGNGVNNMRSRAAELKGVFTIESKPGMGTKVSVIFPLGSIKST